MTQHEIETPQDLDAAIRRQRASKHSQLWRVAEGRSFRWVDALGLLLAALLLGVSVVGFKRVADDSSGMLFVALFFALAAILMLATCLWGLMHRQVKALTELVKRLEEDALDRHAGA